MKVEKVELSQQLKSCISYLRKHQSVALDLEFDKNLHHYGFNICLIQIAAGDRCFLIDPLSKEMDYTLIFDIIEDQNIEKIVFAFGEDHRLLNSLNCYPKNVFDLNNATKLLNFEPGSLSKYILEVLDIEVSASAQLSNWYSRPLSDKQITYASEDVMYLHALKAELINRSHELSITDWIAEENAVVDDQVHEIDYEIEHIKEKDKKGLNEVQWYQLKKVLELREKMAKKINRPSFYIMDMKFLKSIIFDNNELSNWDMKRGMITSLRTETFKSRLYNLLQKAKNEAQKNGLSEDKPAKRKATREEIDRSKALKKKIDQLKVSHFKPIQNLIRRDFGEHTTTFILSNRLIESIVKHESFELLMYKKVLIKKYAEELQIDLTEIFISSNNK